MSQCSSLSLSLSLSLVLLLPPSLTPSLLTTMSPYLELAPVDPDLDRADNLLDMTQPTWPSTGGFWPYFVLYFGGGFCMQHTHTMAHINSYTWNTI